MALKTTSFICFLIFICCCLEVKSAPPTDEVQLKILWCQSNRACDSVLKNLQIVAQIFDLSEKDRLNYKKLHEELTLSFENVARIPPIQRTSPEGLAKEKNHLNTIERINEELVKIRNQHLTNTLKKTQQKDQTAQQQQQNVQKITQQLQNVQPQQFNQQQIYTQQQQLFAQQPNQYVQQQYNQYQQPTQQQHQYNQQQNNLHQQQHQYTQHQYNQYQEYLQQQQQQQQQQYTQQQQYQQFGQQLPIAKQQQHMQYQYPSQQQQQQIEQYHILQSNLSIRTGGHNRNM